MATKLSGITHLHGEYATKVTTVAGIIGAGATDEVNPGEMERYATDLGKLRATYTELDTAKTALEGE